VQPQPHLVQKKHRRASRRRRARGRPRGRVPLRGAVGLLILGTLRAMRLRTRALRSPE
jgi:hypothetical protein